MGKDVTFLRRYWTGKKRIVLARREKLAMQLFGLKTCQSVSIKTSC